MSQIELDMFQSFYSYKLDNGANNFKIDLLLDDRGLLEYEVTPLSGLRASHFAVGYFTVNMTVLCIEQKYMTEEVYDFFDETGLPLDSIDDLLVADEALDEFVNTTLPSYLAL